ncbi:MAG TPA: putative ABC exporter domain-containing protein [Isosphaeraceae bacterium]|jgi:hypothetical protein|nr:putative ABC exporter domain-containing protein [Isosphaeraceae bacterium]
MDEALWLLLGLRLKAWGRRVVRGLKSPKGIILWLFGLGLFATWLMSILLPSTGGAGRLVEPARRYGPFFLLVWCLLSLILSTGERAIQFTPAEVNLLFSAPFSRRQLLAYKLWVILGGVLVFGVFMAVAMRTYSPTFLSAYVGMVLMGLFGQLLTMAVALIGATIGAAANTWRRRLALAILLAVVVVVAASVGRRALAVPTLEALQSIPDAPAVRAVLTPFRWFLLAFTARHLWPDLVEWGALAGLIDAGLVLLIFSLDAHYLETAAAAGEKVYALREAIRRGRGIAAVRKPGRARGRVPMLPWWGGAGPIAWRQLTGARREVARLVVLLFCFAMTTGMGIFLFLQDTRRVQVWAPFGFQGTLFWLTMILGTLTAFDFRADIDRMDVLKSLPISPLSLVYGQLFAPVVIVTGLQWLAMLPLGIASGARPLFWGIAAFALPFNLLLVAVENLMFLWFPSRIAAGAPPAGDLQAMGQLVLLVLAKVVALTVAAGFSTLCALGVYFLLGRNLAAAMAAGWLAALGVGVAITPLIALAFRKFDVASDVPD